MKQKIITIRKQKGYTQTQVANKLNISVQRYCMYEKGTRKLPVNIAKKFSQVFKVTLDEIYS